MRTSSRYERDDILVEKQAGTRSASGYSGGSTSTVLDCPGDAQDLSKMEGGTPAALESGGLVFFATADVSGCSPGMDATVTLEDGTVLDCTVEEVLRDDRSLTLSTDG